MTNNERKKNANYRKRVVSFEENGLIDYNPDRLKDIVGGEKLSYDEYLAIQERSAGHIRGSFQACYYNYTLSFKGQIEKRTKDKICFKRIFVEGMYPDGSCFDGKEDHVWMDTNGFGGLKEGDAVSFYAEVYRYIKTGNGKFLDFGLRNPQNVKKIVSYELPSNDALLKQQLELMVCDTCYLFEQCNRVMCYLPKHEKARRVEDLFRFLKAQQDNNDEVELR